jgi:hypothetical protein
VALQGSITTYILALVTDVNKRCKIATHIIRADNTSYALVFIVLKRDCDAQKGL